VCVYFCQVCEFDVGCYKLGGFLISKSYILFIAVMSLSLNAYSNPCFNNTAKNSIDSKLELLVNSTIKNHISNYNIPAATILIGNSRKVLYKKAFGKIDSKTLNTTRTIFDLASISKLFTAVSLLKELENKNMKVDERILDVFPTHFNSKRKSTLTFEDLLRHGSGFKAGTGNSVFTDTLSNTWKNILNIEPSYQFGEFKYSDINFLVLGKSLSELANKSLDNHVKENIFDLIGMKNSGYNMHSKEKYKNLCAPTNSDIKRGLVHDPTSRKLDGIAGHAGVFSTIDDMSKFASVFLNKGMFCNQKVISEDILDSMTRVDETTGRGLGFDMLSPYSRRPLGDYFDKGLSFGHTGFTGTSLWIDPTKDIFVILLTNTVFAKNEKYAKKGFLNLNLELANIIGKSFSYK
jgi:CubicO group peptidase (beta-lactamase class C family)